MRRRLRSLVTRGTEATPEDIEYCYRLLLGRVADDDGRQHLLGALPLTVDDLVRRFLNSREFRSRPLVLQTIGGDDEETEAVEVEGFTILVRTNDQDIGRAIVRNRVYEPHVSTVLRRIALPGATVLDVGANIGWFSLLAASLVGDGGHVHSVEANFKNCGLLHRSARRNGFEGRLTLHPLAASDEVATLYLAPQAGSNGIVDGDAAFADQFDVQIVHAMPLDDLLADLERLDVVKIDIEGGEFRALQGMRKLLERFRPEVLTEYSPALLREVSRIDPTELLAFWRELGYSAELLLPGSVPEPVGLDADALTGAQAKAGSDHVDLHLKSRS